MIASRLLPMLLGDPPALFLAGEGVEITVLTPPFRMVAGQVHVPGVAIGQLHSPGIAAGQLHKPGPVIGQTRNY